MLLYVPQRMIRGLNIVFANSFITHNSDKLLEAIFAVNIINVPYVCITSTFSLLINFIRDQYFYLNYYEFSIKSYVLDVY